MTEQSSYDRRLFGGGLRRNLHMARFLWLEEQTRGLSGAVIELGCFNARSLDHLAFKPTRYYGVDAGVEGGLFEAIEKYPEHAFKLSTDPEDVAGEFDLAITLETLEHIPRAMLPTYLEKLSQVSPLLLITVPMEIGPVFAAKFLAKLAMRSYPQPHSLMEFVNQTLGRSSRVEQDDHKGFDYRTLLKLLDKHFIIDRVDGLPFPLPPLMNFSVGIRARSRAFLDQER